MLKRKKLWDIEPEHAQELANAARVEACGRVRSRMLAVRHLLSGHAIEETAGLFVIGRSQLYHWLHRYRVEGLPGLQDRPRSGAPRRLKPADENAFRKLLAAGVPATLPQSADCRIRTIRALLREQFNACYSMSGVYMLLHRLGLSEAARSSVVPDTADAAFSVQKSAGALPPRKAPDSLPP